MGKYSLDAFEVHPLMKLRPVMTAPTLCSYRLLEPQKEWKLQPGCREPVVLRLELDMEEIEDAECVLRSTGEACAGGAQLAGVVLETGCFTGEACARLVHTYRVNFPETVLLAEPGTEAVKFCRRDGVSFGLWLDLERGILPLRRSIAQNGLARVWEKNPVYIHAGRALTEEELDAARRWHACGADCPAPLGAGMTLRRMMFPKELTSGGVLPLRMWWQNLGTAPLYQDARVVLELRGGAERYGIAIPENRMRPGLGDTTFNTTAQLPELACGTYELRCGLEANGKLLPLAMDAPEEAGMYRIGEMTLDHTDRPYLATMWERQYADGYYPLEDPAQPE